MVLISLLANSPLTSIDSSAHTHTCVLAINLKEHYSFFFNLILMCVLLGERYTVSTEAHRLHTDVFELQMWK